MLWWIAAGLFGMLVSASFFMGKLLQPSSTHFLLRLWLRLGKELMLDQLFQHTGSYWRRNSQLLAVMQSLHNFACQKEEEEKSVTACHASCRITSCQNIVVCQL